MQFLQFFEPTQITENPVFAHQNGHISAHDKARTFNEGFLIGSDSTLSRGFVDLNPETVSVQENDIFQKE